ncbi:hypothetical protein VNI00_011768 [Paramarasmius palmivorus]|uniref:Mg2+ transporter protein, CorA-like/Zinc transport protein ZntB n=1 Tax=Paramarasmius palmivorus TaxID=297713 RepID=A0AAW0C813_9AGAR
MSYDINNFGLSALPQNLTPRRQPAGPHRHATPSGPWPFLDVSDEIDTAQLTSPPPQPPADLDEYDEEQGSEEDQAKSKQSDWNGYPRSIFANWTAAQQEKSGIAKVVNRRAPLAEPCRVYKVDVWSDGTFHDDDGEWAVKTGKVGSEDVKKSVDDFWNNLQVKPSSQVRVRALFVDNLSGPVLRMLGTRFQIEPFFFSSSLKQIPSRYQEQVRPGKGDHITITLNFIRPLANPSTVPPSPQASFLSTESDDADLYGLSSVYFQEQAIDINGPLKLSSAPGMVYPELLYMRVEEFDLLGPGGVPQRSNSASSMSRSPPAMRKMSTASNTSRLSQAPGGVSTIISYHPPSPSHQTTTASTMRTRLLAAGQSVYWSRIFKSTVNSGDPTFIALSLLWYAMYAWDEVLELLLNEVGWLESQTLSTLPHPDHPDRDPHYSTHILTHKLHVLRAHLLHYQSLLSDFRKSVMFLRKTANPALASESEPTEGFQPGQRRPSVPRINTADLPPRPTRQQTLSAVPESPGTAASVAHAYQETADETTSGLPSRSPWLLREQFSNRYFDEEVVEMFDLDDEFEDSEPQERLLKKESRILLNEIERLEMTSRMLDKRLGNVMQLAFSSVNIEDSKRMAKLAEAAGRDSAVMKQISYLTMVFLPASFIATVFGMNIQELTEESIPKLYHYLATAIPLTIVTMWIMMLLYRTQKRPQSVEDPNFTRLPPPPSLRLRMYSWLSWPLGALNVLLRSFPHKRSKDSDMSGSWSSTKPEPKSRIGSARSSMKSRQPTLRRTMIPASNAQEV